MAGRTYGGESAADRAARRRRRLMDAGLELFGTVGYTAATVRQLCREARVADRYFYEEFASTEDLLLAVYHECLDRLRDAVVAGVDGADGEIPDIARAGLLAFLTEVRDDPRLARVVWFEVLGVSRRVEQAYLARMAEFADLVAALLADRLPQVATEDVETRVVRLAAIGGVSHVVMTWVDAGFEPAVDRVAAGLQTLLRSIAAGLADA